MHKYQKGQTIVEAIVALMTILIIITAISTVIVSGLYNSRFIKNQNEANKYAQGGIEFVRNYQRNNLTDFSATVNGGNNNSIFCIDEANQVLYATGTNPYDSSKQCLDSDENISSFNRTVTFDTSGSKCSSDEVVVTVTVKWKTSKCPVGNRFCHKSQLEACMIYRKTGSNP